MSERTGVTREARRLSGTDIGREVLINGAWETIWDIWHSDHCTEIGISEYHDYPITLAPTDTVTIRGRDE